MAIDFYRASREGHSDTLRIITKRDANKAGDDGMTPVHWAASYGNLEGLRILMRKGYVSLPLFITALSLLGLASITGCTSNIGLTVCVGLAVCVYKLNEIVRG